MATITLKDIPRNLHLTLKRRAAANHRSLNKEVLATLEASTQPTESVSVANLQNEAVRARSYFKRIVSAKEITTWKKKGRL